MFVMNKKGFLLVEETLKIVIALISITFLVYFLVSLYTTNQNNKNLELAKASLEHLIGEVNSDVTQVEIYNPPGWVIISWPFKGERPNSCSNLGWVNCLCVCEAQAQSFVKMVSENIGSIFGYKPQSENIYVKGCDAKGICREISKEIRIGENLNEQGLILIKKPFTKLDIDYGEEKIKIK